MIAVDDSNSVFAGGSTTQRSTVNAVLHLEKVVAGYGEGIILQGLDLVVDEYETVGVVGPNGAGKSTTLRAVMGGLRIHDGDIRLRVNEHWQSLNTWRTINIVKSGVAIVPQVDNVFATLSVAENFAVVRHLCGKTFDASVERVLTIFPELKNHWRHAAGSLSGGQRQMVAIGRALLPSPRLILLDEPTAGLSPAMTKQTFNLINQLRQARHTSILLVEQNARAALEVCDHGYVLVSGRTKLHAPAANILAHPEMTSIFLGTKTTATHS